MALAALLVACSGGGKGGAEASIPDNVHAVGYSRDMTTSVFKHLAVKWNRGGSFEYPVYARQDGHRYAACNSVHVAGRDVYVAGFERWEGLLPTEDPDRFDVRWYAPSARLWKNGEKFSVGNNPSEISEAHSVFVQGDVIYVGGYTRFSYSEAGTVWYDNAATVWVNDAPLYLSPYAHDAQVLSVFVAGDDVYAAGYEDNKNNPSEATYAMLWKNGAPQRLTYDGFSAQAHSVFVDGDDVYVAGVKHLFFDQGISLAMLWKNGVPQPLHASGKFNGEAKFVAAHEGDVYVAGTEFEIELIPYGVSASAQRPAIWKNGRVEYLDYAKGASFQEAEILSLCFSGGDIYASGWQRDVDFSSNPPYLESAAVWRNDKCKILGSKGHRSFATGVYVEP